MPSRARLRDHRRDRSDRGRCRAAPRRGPARPARSPPPRCGRRRRAGRRDSGCGRRRFPSTPSAGRPRCADSRRCTSPTLPRRPVVIDLLVGAAGDAHAPAAALVLVDQDDAVLLALVDRARRARRDAGRVEAMLAQPRQIHHEGVFELAVDVLLHAFEVARPSSAWRTRRREFPPSSGPIRSSPSARR